MTTLSEVLTTAVHDAFGQTLAAEVQEIVARETRTLFRQHESAFAAIVKTAVDRAFADLLKEPLQ